MLPPTSENYLDLLSHKLYLLKKQVKDWTKEKGSILESDSLKIDEEIGVLLSGSSSGILSLKDQLTLDLLRSKKKICWTITFSLGSLKAEPIGLYMVTPIPSFFMPWLQVEEIIMQSGLWRIMMAIVLMRRKL